MQTAEKLSGLPEQRPSWQGHDTAGAVKRLGRIILFNPSNNMEVGVLCPILQEKEHPKSHRCRRGELGFTPVPVRVQDAHTSPLGCKGDSDVPTSMCH